IIIWIEKNPPQVRVHEVEELSIRDAIWIGLIQVLSLIPGTSRSGATIIGAMFLGVSRKAATEFSFFLGMPVIIGAGLLGLYQGYDVLSTADDCTAIGVARIVSFPTAS